MLKRKSKYYVYILEAPSGAYYTGFTSNLENRIDAHSKGTGAKYLRGRGPFRLVYAKEYKYLKNAMHAERNIKKYTKVRKTELMKCWANAKQCVGAPKIRLTKGLL